MVDVYSGYIILFIVLQTESFEAPTFASAVKKVGINSEQPDHLTATFTPLKSEVRVEVNEKYFSQPIKPKSKTVSDTLWTFEDLERFYPINCFNTFILPHRNEEYSQGRLL